MGKEKWLDVVGYEGLYQVSDHGSVRSLDRKVWGGKSFYTSKGKVLKNCISNTDGYYRVNLSFEGFVRTRLVHQLVAEAFLGHISNRHRSVVDHKNEIKTDNRVSNLRIVTHRFNVSRGTKNASGYTGVHKSRNRYRAVIYNKNIKIHIGMFDTAKEAYSAYINAKQSIERDDGKNKLG